MASQAEIDLIVNASNTLPQITRDLDRIVNRAEDGADTIDLNAALNSQASLAGLAADLDRVVADADPDDIDLDAVLNTAQTVARLRGDLDSVIARAQQGANQDPVQLRAVLDGPRSLVAVRGELDRVITTAQRTADDIDVDVDIDTDRLFSSVRRLLPELDGVTRTATRAAGALGSLGAGIGAVGAATGATLPLLASLVTAVESVLPASAVATQGLLAMQLASGTLKLGLMGVEDALTAAFDPDADPEELAESLKRLAPEARAFVKELQGMRKEFSSLQLGVQNRLFKDLDGGVQLLAESTLPLVRRALNDTANSLNDMAVGAITAAATLSRDGTLGRALDGATQGIENLRDVPGQAVTAFGQLAAAAAPAFDRITQAVARVADSVSESLTGAFESGALEDAINDAIDVIAQLGRIAGNVFGTVGNLLDAASTGGDGLFSTLEKITGALEDVTGTEEFQAAISALVETMGVLADNVIPLFVIALKSVGDVVRILAPVAQRLIEVLGDQLEGILEAAREPLAALAEAFGELVIALLPVLELAGELIVALLPALTPLFETLRDIIIELAPVIEQLALNIAAQLVPILERLPEILEVVLPPFVELAEQVFPLLADLLLQLQPSLEEMATALGDLAVELAPLTAKFLELTTLFLEKVLPVLGPILVKLFQVAAQTITFFADVIEDVVMPALRGLKDLFNGDVAGALVNFGEAAENLKALVRAAFWAMVREATTALGNLVIALRQKAIDATAQFLRGIENGFDRAIRFIAGIPSRAVRALGNVGGLLYNAGASLIQGLIRGIGSQVAALQSKLSSITSLIPDWKGPAERDAELLTENGRLIMQSLIDGFDDVLPDVRATLGGVTDSIPESVGVPSSGAGAPVVYVTIGNEAVDQYVTARVRQHDDNRTRTMAQGVRR